LLSHEQISFRKKINVPKERAYTEYQFKPIIIGHACVNLIFEPVFEISIADKKKHVPSVKCKVYFPLEKKVNFLIDCNFFYF